MRLGTGIKHIEFEYFWAKEFDLTLVSSSNAYKGAKYFYKKAVDSRGGSLLCNTDRNEKVIKGCDKSSFSKFDEGGIVFGDNYKYEIAKFDSCRG